MTRPSSQTRVVLHNHPRQPHGCLAGLARYAQAISETPVARSFPSLEAYERWSMRQPVKLDVGEGPISTGCVPAQRSRLWPQDGLNCWETTGHYVGVALAQNLPLEVHVYDRDFGPFRHVYPAVRRIGDTRPPVPVLLQPSLPKRTPAQGWENDLLGAVHLAGSAALSIFGMSAHAAALERLEAPHLPEWARIYTPPAYPQQPTSPLGSYPPAAPGPGAMPGAPMGSGAYSRAPLDGRQEGADPLVFHSPVADYLARASFAGGTP